MVRDATKVAYLVEFGDSLEVFASNLFLGFIKIDKLAGEEIRQH